MREVERLRMEERKHRFSDDPEMEGVPEEEGIDDADVDDRLEDDPTEVPNRRDVDPD